VLSQLVRLHPPQRGTNLVHQGDADRVLRRRQLDQPAPALVTGGQSLGEEVTEQEDLYPALTHPGHELVVLVLRALYPEHVIEQELIVVGRGHPLEAELRPVDHHLAQPTHFGVDPERCHHVSLPAATAITI
jgi:hypothetical protein